MKILILALSGIGDALMFTPALRLLRRSLPDAGIDALVMFKGVDEMYQRNSDLNNVIFFDFMKEGSVRSVKFLLKLRGSYDAVINVYPSNRKEYNVISFLTGANKRAAVKYLRMHRSSLGMLNNILVEENDARHNVETNILLVEKLLNSKFEDKPGLKFELSDGDKKFAESFLKEKNIRNDELVVGIHPGCATLKNHINRRWEPEKFSLLSIKLIENYNAKILIFGGPEESELKELVLKKINSDNSVKVITENLPQSAAIMKRCNLFITNDSSLMHIASALNLNVVAIIGPTNTDYIHPWNTDHRIVSLNLECAPCFFYSPKPLFCYRNDILYKCIKELTVDMVYSAAVKFIDEKKSDLKLN